MVEPVIKNLEPRSASLLFISLIGLTLLASYLYLFKQPWQTLAATRLTLEELRSQERDPVSIDAEIEAIESEITDLRQELNGDGPVLPPNQLVAHIIRQLDQSARANAVQLGGVRPGNRARVLMFSELPFHVEVSGSYHNLYRWLNEVESRLGPLVVKQFEISPLPGKDDDRQMQLTIVSYRYEEK